MPSKFGGIPIDQATDSTGQTPQPRSKFGGIPVNQAQDTQPTDEQKQPDLDSDQPSVGGFVRNAVKSGLQTVGGMANAVLHPIDTAANLATTAAGVAAQGSGIQGPKGSFTHDVAVPTAEHVEDFYKQRYGGASQIAHTLYTDPVGVAADVSSVADLAGGALRGGAALADAANAGRAASALRTGADAAKAASTFTNPASLITGPAKLTRNGIVAMLGGATKNGLSPVEQSAVNYALNDPQLKQSVDAATATGNQFLGSAKSMLKKSPGSAGIMADAGGKQTSDILGKMDDVAASVAPNGAKTLLTAGASAKNVINSKIGAYASKADAAYQKLKGIADQNAISVKIGDEPVKGANGMTMVDANGNTLTRPVMKKIAGPVDLGAVKSAAKPLLDELEDSMRQTQKASSPALDLLREIVNGDDVVSLRKAIDDNSTIKEIAANSLDPTVKRNANRIAAALADPYEKAIENTASGLGADARKAFDAGKQATINKHELKDYTVDVRQDGSNVEQFVKSITAGDGKSLPTLQILQKHTPQMLPDVARATLEDVFSHAAGDDNLSKVAGAIKKWNGIGDETKNILFGQQTAQEVNDLLHYAKISQGELNRSGSASVGHVAGLAALLMHDPMKAIAAMAGSRMMAQKMVDPALAAKSARGAPILPTPGRAVTVPAKVAAAAINKNTANVGRAANQGVESEVVPPPINQDHATLPRPDAKPGPYLTQLAPEQEQKFQNWVQQNNVPFDASQRADYDMRGFWKALQNGDPKAKTAINQSDGKMHFPDTWKTPYHKTFSAESMYATSDAPHWQEDRLISKDGHVIADETPHAASIIRLRAPNGEEKDVPAEQAQHYLDLGATKIQ